MTTSDPPADLRVAPGDAWLLSHSPAPAEARRLWSHDRFAPLPATAWCVAEGRCLRSLEAIRPLQCAGLLGPVLVDPAADAAWWLLAAGAEEHLADIPILTPLSRPATENHDEADTTGHRHQRRAPGGTPSARSPPVPAIRGRTTGPEP
ncbi:hypothetical protein [Streptomyces lunalinharesii]|uniref:Uncharacterized protein n=1 Tax=Streptomyces lunalinharesii TaxID=333384 RepID=A0ABN3T8J0_9ACTN